MVELRKGTIEDSAVLAPLIFASAPVLLQFLFGKKEMALRFIEHAAKQADGQYSSARHTIASSDNSPIGCMTVWHASMPESFHAGTLTSLHEFLEPSVLSHLIRINPLLEEVFLPPQKEQLCIGHLSVAADHQGCGVGRKLIAHAIKLAKNSLLNSIVLDVEDSNEQAISFYHACGFIEITKSRFSPTEQNFVRMEFRLN